MPAGGGKLRQEVQPGKGGEEMLSAWGWSHHGGLLDAAFGGGGLLIWGGTARWHWLLAMMLLQQLLQRCGIFYGWGRTPWGG